MPRPWNKGLRTLLAERLYRLQQPPGPGSEGVRPFVGRPVQVAVGQQHRQHHVAAALPQGEDEAARVRLGL